MLIYLAAGGGVRYSTEESVLQRIPFYEKGIANPKNTARNQVRLITLPKNIQ